MPTQMGFTGQRADATTGLYYYGARYYDPTAQQFTSPDSVPSGLNRYAYVHDNSTSRMDPSGHMECVESDCSEGAEGGDGSSGSSGSGDGSGGGQGPSETVISKGQSAQQEGITNAPPGSEVEVIQEPDGTTEEYVTDEHGNPIGEVVNGEDESFGNVAAQEGPSTEQVDTEEGEARAGRSGEKETTQTTPKTPPSNDNPGHPSNPTEGQPREGNQNATGSGNPGNPNNPGTSGASAPGQNPLEGTQYTDKVQQQMSQDVFHGFPTTIDEYGEDGEVYQRAGGDGVVRTWVEIPGSVNGQSGVFQYIIEPDGVTINHRLFVPDR